MISNSCTPRNQTEPLARNNPASARSQRTQHSRFSGNAWTKWPHQFHSGDIFGHWKIRRANHGCNRVIETYVNDKTFISRNPVLLKDIDIIIGANFFDGCWRPKRFSRFTNRKVSSRRRENFDCPRTAKRRRSSEEETRKFITAI